jgi:hypothetical protein
VITNQQKLRGGSQEIPVAADGGRVRKGKSFASSWNLTSGIIFKFFILTFKSPEFIKFRLTASLLVQTA